MPQERILLQMMPHLRAQPSPGCGKWAYRQVRGPDGAKIDGLYYQNDSFSGQFSNFFVLFLWVCRCRNLQNIAEIL